MPGPIQYQNIPEDNFSLGIDARSSENQIGSGFVRDLLNADVVEKRVRTRQGYQGFAGNVPVRVTSMEYKDAENEVCFTLDSSVALDTAVSLDSIRSSPLVIFGRSSIFTSGQGPFTDVDSVHYYPKFTIPTRKQFIAPSGVLTVPGTEHGLGTTNLFSSVVESTSLVNRSYQFVESDFLAINESSFDLTLGYTTSVNRDVFVFFRDETPAVGSSYVASVVHSGTPATQTFTIPAGTHALSNFNIITQIQQDIGTTRIQVIPDSFLIATNGDISISITNGTGAAATYYIILSTTPISNTATGVINSVSTGTVTISNVTKPWVFFGIYLEQTPGGIRELVFPDTIDYDDISKQFILSFTNLSSVARNFIVYYEYGDVRSNQLCVSDTSVAVNGTDDVPQITIWGLDHEEIYTTKTAHEGWVTHIDSYRRSGEQRMVCGLGGNLFSAREFSEAAVTYAYPQLYPRLFSRTLANQILAPLFWDSGDIPQRTRGYITSDISGSHWAIATSVRFDVATGWTVYSLSLPNKLILDSTANPTSLASVISTGTNLEDWLTVQNMSYARHNGSFRIRQVVDGINQVQIYVENSTNSSDYDDSGTAGEAGVFTDQFTWASNGEFIPGDLLVSEVLGDLFICTVLSGTGTTTVTNGITDKLEVPGGVQFNGQRVSSVVPLRTPNPNTGPSATNLVRGDMLSYTGIPRLLRVLNINADSDRSLDIAGDGTTATVSMTSGDTSFVTEGQKILLVQAGGYSGIQTVGTLLSSSQFTFASSLTDSITGALLIGETAEIDEELQWEDTLGDMTTFRVEERWIPLEAPDDSFDLTPSTHIRYFDTNQYSDQPFVRSTMVVDNEYYTNYDDEVLKNDGSSIYRAGLISWQPGLFLTQETSGTVIVANLRSIPYSAITAAGEGRLQITADTTNILPADTSVRLSGSDQTYTVKGYTDDGTDFYILLDRTIDGSVSASGTVAEIGTLRYYMRLNAVDINNNIIASATTGSEDHVVELTGNAAIRLRSIGLPNWDVYDFDRLELQIYRTKFNTPAPFYLVTTIPMSFDNTLGYIDYVDSFVDSDLTQLDVVNTALKGQELGIGWTDPLRAKYVTSIGNKLVLANVRDYPQLDIQIVADGSFTDATIAGDTLLFRKDNEDSGTTSDSINRIRYEWINGPTGTASAFTIGTNTFSFTTSSATGATTGDWIYLTYATVAKTGRDLSYSGWWQIASVSGTTVTVNLVGAAAASSYPDSYVIATNTVDVPVLLGTDGNLGMVNGDSFDIFDAMRRMSMAINSSMRMVDISLSGLSGFQPWMVSRAGNDLSPAGRLQVRQPRSDQTTMEMVPTFSGYSLFVNSIRRSSTDQISASTRIYPSRIIVSYQNYPEIFDNPTSVLDTDSDSAIDINSADGQEITGVIPFFGEAAFTASQQAAVLVVFKTNSIYLVDLNQKAAGQNPVQRIETEGLGCSAPYSITSSKSGIPFANESGMYILRRTQAIEYVGRFMERNWVERVDLQRLDLVQGHHWGSGRMYKASVPLLDTENTTTGYIENSEAYVYNHTGEDIMSITETGGQSVGRGAWSRYDNHSSIGWANLASDAFFASSTGRVFSIRQTGTATDFRDDNQPIHFLVESRPNDSGSSGIRKILDGVIIHYRSGARNTGTSVSYSVDIEEEFTPTTPIIIPTSTRLSNTDMSDTVLQSIISIRHDVSRRKGIYFSIRVENSTIDESLEIAGMDFRVAGMTDKGILTAAATAKK